MRDSHCWPIQRLSLTLLLALGLAFPALAQDLDIPLPPPAAEGAQTYSELEVSEGVWEVCLRNGSDFGALGTGFEMMMRMAQVTVDKGYVYYHESDGRQLAPDVFAVRVQMWTEPPEGAHVVRWDDPATFEGKDTAEFVVTHAASWLAQYDRDTMREQVQLSKRRREELMSTRTVEVDELGLERRRFAPDVEVGGVSSMAFEARDSAWPAPVFVSEKLRVLWFGVDGALVAEVALPEREPKIPGLARGPSSLRPYTPRAGEVGFLATGGGWSPVGAYSADGTLLWEYARLPFGGREHAPNELAAGDLDGDGEAEFVIGTNGSGGVFFLDERGRIDHRHPGSNVFSVAILDADGDGRPEVIHSGRGELVVRDGEGVVQPKAPRPVGFTSSFNAVPGREGVPSLANASGDALILSHADGTGGERFTLPLNARSSDVHAAWLRRSAESEALLAVTIGGEVRDHLYVFALGGRLVHHELLGAAGSSGLPLVTLPRTDAPDALLVGTYDGLWLYEFDDAR